MVPVCSARRGFLSSASETGPLDLARDLGEWSVLKDEEVAEPVELWCDILDVLEGRGPPRDDLAHLSRADLDPLLAGRERDAPLDDDHAQILVLDPDLEARAEHQRIARASAHDEGASGLFGDGEVRLAVEPDLARLGARHDAQSAAGREPHHAAVAQRRGDLLGRPGGELGRGEEVAGGCVALPRPREPEREHQHRRGGERGGAPPPMQPRASLLPGAPLGRGDQLGRGRRRRRHRLCIGQRCAHLPEMFKLCVLRLVLGRGLSPAAQACLFDRGRLALEHPEDRFVHGVGVGFGSVQIGCAALQSDRSGDKSRERPDPTIRPLAHGECQGVCPDRVRPRGSTGRGAGIRRSSAVRDGFGSL
jgi:hypothetical protein